MQLKKTSVPDRRQSNKLIKPSVNSLHSMHCSVVMWIHRTLATEIDGLR